MRTSLNTLRSTLFVAILVSGAMAGTANAQSTAPQTEPAPATDGASSQPMSDTWITTKVKTELLAAQDVSGMDIKVDTVNGVVNLSGTVDSQTQVDKAVAVARQIDGVKKVDSKRLVASTGK